MCKDFAMNFGDKITGYASQQRTNSHFLSHQEIFDQKEHECRPQPVSDSSVKEKAERPPF
jgi:hypothetical protein